jgi:hypothetical protein
MKTRFIAIGALAMAFVPLLAQAINCDYGCKHLGCLNAMAASPLTAGQPSGISYNSVNSHQYANNSAAPIPLEAPFPSGGSGGGLCDTFNVPAAAGNNHNAMFLQRDVIGPGVTRHRVMLDLSGYVGNTDPVSGQRSWWPGLVTWMIPVEAHSYGAELRVDYSGTDGILGPNTHSGNHLRLMLDDVFLDSVTVERSRISIELQWTTDGQAVVLVHEHNAASTTPDGWGTIFRTSDLPVTGTATSDFYPRMYLLGRRGAYFERWSTGTILFERSEYMIPVFDNSY